MGKPFGPWTRCKHCKKTMADWVEIDGINWTIRLKAKGEKWICQFCAKK